MPALTFEQFQLHRETQLSRHSGLLDLTETKMARALSPWTLPEAELTLPSQGYRCHVADAWLACFGLPAAWKARTLVTQGVRASLKTLFEHAHSEGLRVALPGDVYPVYEQLAQVAGLPSSAVMRYESLTAGGLQELLSLRSAPDASLTPDWVLVTSPCKPAGTVIASAELDALRAWLSQDPKRRVIVDAVYEFESRIAPEIASMLPTDQLIYLHSLSKGWAAPLKAGVLLVPQQDVASLTFRVRALPVDKAGLRLAQGLLESDPQRPVELARVLNEARQQLHQTLVTKGLRPGLLPSLSAARALTGQYLFLLPAPFETLQAKHGVLAMPVSVFGSARDDLAVVSSLAYVR